MDRETNAWNRGSPGASMIRHQHRHRADLSMVHEAEDSTDAVRRRERGS